MTSNDEEIRLAPASDERIQLDDENNEISYKSKWPAVELEFQDLTYSVPGLNGSHVILRGVSGAFRSGQLTAILGQSGAGKTTLLSIMAGFKTGKVTGTVLVNGQQRDMGNFRKVSRYIMQQSLFQPMLSVREAMVVAAHLKLGYDLNQAQKNKVIDDILTMLRLTKASNTMGEKLSGGEQKRLSIALELVNNPPVILLDEPTTGLDDLSSSQCMQLLQRVAHGGRTIVCTIHTPSAKIFDMFDSIYVVADGQCAYQGHGRHIVSFLKQMDLVCPMRYNPADFVLEVTSGEYGNEFVEQMVTLVENGKCYSWEPDSSRQTKEITDFQYRGVDEVLFHSKHLRTNLTGWQQFCILYKRRATQMLRDKNYLKLTFLMNLYLALVVSGIYQGVGNDASKALINFGFCFTVAIAFMYNPMMPVLLTIPSEIDLIKREHFNRWFRIGPYFCAMIVAKLPIHMAINIGYITIIYLATDQPLELNRMAMFYSISLLVALTSESLGTLLSSRLSLVNAMFVGPVMTVPLMLLAVYGMGFGPDGYPFYMRIIMSLSYVRYGLEGIIDAIYGYKRVDLYCPDTELFCMFRNSEFLKDFLGFHDADYMVSVVGLCMYYVFYTTAAFFMIKTRISRTKTNYVAFQYVGAFVKNHLNFASYKY